MFDSFRFICQEILVPAKKDATVQVWSDQFFLREKIGVLPGEAMVLPKNIVVLLGKIVL